MRDAEQTIASAVQRGAISESRAGHYRALAAAGQDVSWLDQAVAVFAPQPIRAAAPGQVRQYRDVAAAMPPGADPALYGANPLLVEMQRDKPALVAAARAEGSPVPELFGDSALPRFCASGLDPAVLATLPWPLRRPVAAAPTLAAAYELVDRYAPPDGDSAALLALRYSRSNVDYLQAFSQWLVGSGRAQDGGTQPASQPRHPQTGQFTSAAAQDQPDYVGEALYRELFGT